MLIVCVDFVIKLLGFINEGIVLDGNILGKDVDNQQSRIFVVVYWSVFDDFESDMVKLFWCVGLFFGLCDFVKEIELINNSMLICYFFFKFIMNGYCYFVIVKVINGVGVILLFKFDGVMVDDIFLIFGFVVDGLGLDRNYVNGEDDVSVSWFVFMDLEFGIDFYKVVLCYERNLFNCFQFFIFIGKIINVIILGEELVYVCKIFFFFLQ